MATTQRRPTAERRRQIAEAALQILASHGARRLTAAALAEEVGIADGTIFRHFRNKEEIVDRAIGLFEDALEDTFPPSDGEPLERLGVFVVNRLTLLKRHPEFLRLAFNDRLAEAAGEKGAERVEQLVRRSMAFVGRCLAEAQERGDISRETPVSLLVWMILGVVRGASSRPGTGRSTKDELARAPAEEVWQALERFLRNTKPESSP